MLLAAPFALIMIFIATAPATIIINVAAATLLL
jgi:hypothetical protein